MYMRWGFAILFLTWLGILPLFLFGSNSGDVRDKWREWFWRLTVVLLGLGLVAIPAIMSIGTLPIRAFVAWPLLAAWMASRVAPNEGGERFSILRRLAIGYFIVVATSIGASMFYVDKVVHDADSALTQRLLPAMQQAGAPLGGGDVPFTLVGKHEFPFREDAQIQPAELFGTSFYEQDEGNLYRVYLYMELQGVSGFTPVPLIGRPDLIAAQQAMPSWPAAGSIKLVNGVVIVKLSNPTPPQLPPGG
jgi:hypothetical protein